MSPYIATATATLVLDPEKTINRPPLPFILAEAHQEGCHCNDPHIKRVAIALVLLVWTSTSPSSSSSFAAL